MGLETYIKQKRKEKDILIMTHQILGYPSFEVNEKAIDIFNNNGIDIIELQIPFSEPVADGPTFLNANQAAIKNGVRVSECLDFVEKMVQKYKTPFLIMTYYNIVFKYGIQKFVEKCKEIGVRGLIVPDAPIDDAKDFFDVSSQFGVDAVGLATAYTDDKRLMEISKMCSGFIYYVPRKGVTGNKTTFDKELVDKISCVKEMTGKNIAVGFGIQGREDIEKLRGVSDIAVIGSKVLKVIEEEGINELDGFIKSLT